MTEITQDYFRLLATRKEWSHQKYPAHQRMYRYDKWLERGYRPSRKTRPLFGSYGTAGYDIGWRLNINGRDYDSGKWFKIERDMKDVYRRRKRWKICNNSTGHLFAWRMKQKAKRNWPR